MYCAVWELVRDDDWNAIAAVTNLLVRCFFIGVFVICIVVIHAVLISGVIVIHGRLNGQTTGLACVDFEK